ncbi:MAG: hypothetical protein EH225_11895 [Calditrichaeota bacterium]|nr:hypothetical protein [Calditrichota bacterium]RQV99239.1 MAG: hypothetical protein EH225_11895 [Calditrichota bacterium]
MIKKSIQWIPLIAVLLLWNTNSISQVVSGFQLQTPTPDRNGLVGNGITDLVWYHAGSTLYVGTGYGLSATSDFGESWQNFTPAEYGGKGGISALSVAGDGTVWIATGYDTTVQEDQTLSAGGGLRYQEAGSTAWTFIRQPIDARTDTAGGMRPTTTHVQNVTYDIAILDTQIWISSFGGGIRRSLDRGETWEVITTDGIPFSALDNLNHRGFSALAENGNIWIGTAGGISKSSDGGNNWNRFYVKSDQVPEPGGISGNWVIALTHNPWDNSVWAVTLTTGGEEFNSISRTLDGGRSWNNFLAEELSDGTFARNIAFNKNIVYVATEKGVYKSIDAGRSWYLFPEIQDRVSGEKLLTDLFYSVAISPDAGTFHRLWVGSSDGLAVTSDNGFSWAVFRSFVSTRERPEPSVYAYPNPFSPERGTVIRFQYDIEGASEVKIDIFNFAMERVISLQKHEAMPEQGTYDRSTTWDGRDSNGRFVDNGVYFFRADVSGKIEWGKIVVIN